MRIPDGARINSYIIVAKIADIVNCEAESRELCGSDQRQTARAWERSAQSAIRVVTKREAGKVKPPE